MKKRLVAKDYEEIVFESLKIPKADYHNYYLNIVEERYDYNHNIVANLKQAFGKWITWYNSKIYGKVVKAKMSDGSIQYVDENQAWETDKNGKMTSIDLEKKSIYLLPDFGIEIYVNKAFFDNLIDELSTIQEIIDFKNSVIEFENKLPESIKNKTLKVPMPVGFDFKEIKERFELIKASTNQPLGNIINEPNKTQETIQFKKEKYEIILPKLNEYKFDELEKVSVVDLKILVKHIFTKNLPYQIAYLDYLGFVKSIEQNYTNTKEGSSKLIARILGVNQRAVKGNVNVLNPVSREDKKRYTSHRHLGDVKKHYKNMK